MGPVNDVVTLGILDTDTVYRELANVAYPFSQGITYEFSVTDTGSSIAVSVENTLIFDIDTSVSEGSFVAFMSREWSSHRTTLDNLSFAAVPEPSSVVIFSAFLTAFVFNSARQKRT